MGKNVLCVERNSSLRFLLETVLAREGNVICVTNGFEACTWLNQSPKIHCMILSIESESDENLSLLKHIKTSSLFKSIPVIVLSGTNDKRVRSLCEESHVEFYLSKPFDPLALVNIVGQIPEERGKVVLIKKAEKELKLSKLISI